MLPPSSCSSSFIRTTVLFCIAALGTGLLQECHAQQQTFRTEFLNPDKQFRPMVRWWWPGANVSDIEIRREIDLLDRAGFGGAEIQPFVTFDTRKLPVDQQGKVNAFATPQFFAQVRSAASAAAAHKMWIDTTFGTGWPFGGGETITPELSSIELRFADTVIDGPTSTPTRITIPSYQPGLMASMLAAAGKKTEWPVGWERRFEERSRIVAVVAIRSADQSPSAGGETHGPKMLNASSSVVLTNHLQPDGMLDWQVPTGRWHIFVFRQFPTRQEVIAASGIGPQLVLDHMNKAAFAAHAARVGDPLLQALKPQLGSSFRAVFCDSLEVQAYLFWSDDFLKEFHERRGYDLTPFLPLLRQPGYNDFYFSHPDTHPEYDEVDIGDAVRNDYWKTVSEIMTQNFYVPFDRWATDHKLLSRVQAHGAPVDLLTVYGHASIPETEELAGGNTINFMKLASSAGYDYGRKLISSESFVFGGNPYVTTPESIKANSDKMFVSGINQVIYHGFPYRFQDESIKGLNWYPFQGRFSSDISEQNPIWPYLNKVNAYITRVQTIAQRGKPELQVALFRSAINEDDTGPSSSARAVSDPFPGLEEALTRSGLSFGFVNEDVLMNVKAGGKEIRTGGGAYQAIVVPHETNITPRVGKALEALAAAGVPVIFVGGDPGIGFSYASMEQDEQEIAASLAALTHATSVSRAPDATAAAHHLLKLIVPQVHFVSGPALPFAKWTVPGTHFYFLTNPGDREVHATVKFAESDVPEVWDPWTGGIARTSFSRSGDGMVLQLALPPFGSELLAFNSAGNSRARPQSSNWTDVREQQIGSDGWTIDALGDSEKGVDVAVHIHMDRLEDWLQNSELRTLSGTAKYTTSFIISANDLKTATRVILDLGEVKDAATIKLNGTTADVLVVHPFTVMNIKSLLHPGQNRIEISVANSLTNYMSTVTLPETPGPPVTRPKPVSSGLMGPVVLKFQRTAAGNKQ